MLSIVKADLYRLKYERMIKIVLILAAFFMLTYPVPAAEIFAEAGIEYDVETLRAYGSTAFFNIGFDGFANLLIPLLVVVIFSSEFSKRTFMNIVGTKIDRFNIFCGKMISFSISVFCLVSFCAFLCTLEFTLLYGWGEYFSIVQVLKLLFVVCLVSAAEIAYTGLTIILSTIIHSSSLVVVIYFGVTIVESMFSSVFVALSEHTKGSLPFPIFEYISYWFPSSYLYDLSKLEIRLDSTVAMIVPIVFYIAVTVIIGSSLFKKVEF